MSDEFDSSMLITKLPTSVDRNSKKEFENNSQLNICRYFEKDIFCLILQKNRIKLTFRIFFNFVSFHLVVRHAVFNAKWSFLHHGLTLITLEQFFLFNT